MVLSGDVVDFNGSLLLYQARSIQIAANWLTVTFIFSSLANAERFSDTP
jgi:hypothetical protein